MAITIRPLQARSIIIESDDSDDFFILNDPAEAVQVRDALIAAYPLEPKLAPDDLAAANALNEGLNTYPKYEFQAFSMGATATAPATATADNINERGLAPSLSFMGVA